MQAELLKSKGERVFAVVFETGEDPIAGLTASRSREPERLRLTAIGALLDAPLFSMATCNR